MKHAHDHFRFRCPACGESLTATFDMVGGITYCSECETRLEVPKPTHFDDSDEDGLQELSEVDVITQKRPAPAPHESVMAQEAPVAFSKKRDGEDGELDLTPMVDVTFLLLIFFMVTASFQIQKSMQIPAPKDNSPSSVSQQDEPEDDPDNILVRIDSFNTYYVGCAAWDQEREAPSEQELYRQVRAARDSNSARPPRTLIVIAHEECLHEKVVTALDAGMDAGVDSIRLQSTEEDM